MLPCYFEVSLDRQGVIREGKGCQIINSILPNTTPALFGNVGDICQFGNITFTRLHFGNYFKSIFQIYYSLLIFQ